MRRRAFSLIELLAVISIVALVAVASFGRFGSGTVDSLNAESYVRKLVLDLKHARRRTIATGNNHFLALTLSSGKATSYVLTERQTSSTVAVDVSRTTPANVTVTPSAANLEFDFDGSALASYTIAVNGPARSWTVTTVAATGAVYATETTP